MREIIKNYPPFSTNSIHHFNQSFDNINIEGSEITWKHFQDLFKRLFSLDANVRKTPEINNNVLHLGSWKQAVLKALSLIGETI